jgi:hypothetical protein
MSSKKKKELAPPAMDSCLPDSNQRPLDDFKLKLLQSNALPTELRQVSGPKTVHLDGSGEACGVYLKFKV